MTVRLFAEDNPDGQASACDFGERILHQQLPASEIDDRFRQAASTVAMVLSDDGRATPLGVATKSAAIRRPESSLPPWTIQMALQSGSEDRLAQLVTPLLDSYGAELWVRPENELLTVQIKQHWPEAFICRRLHLMLADLPIQVDPLPTRPLNPDSLADLEAVVRVNNAAFNDHPDQDGMTVQSVREKLAAPGHEASGVRLAEIDGRINGFCWTQIHQQRRLGEISVIGLHPDVQGRGLGGPMTAAGLDWLHHQGLDQAILYVEAHNEPAVRSYTRLGFTAMHDDVSWMIPFVPGDQR